MLRKRAMETAGIILAGGRSRRMGQNKALRRYEPDSPALIERVLTSVQPHVQELLLVTNSPAEYDWLGLPMVGDNWPDSGPLGGIEGGLSAIKSEYALVVACDMPSLAPELITLLVNWERNGWKAIVPLNTDNKVEPLCAVYSKAVLPSVRAQLANGDYKLNNLLGLVDTYYIETNKYLLSDKVVDSFRNLNTPTEWEAAGVELRKTL